MTAVLWRERVTLLCVRERERESEIEQSVEKARVRSGDRAMHFQERLGSIKERERERGIEKRSIERKQTKTADFDDAT